MFGVVAVLGDTASIVGAVVFNSIYPAVRHVMPGLAFILGAAGMALPGVILTTIYCIGTTRRRRVGEER